MKKVLISACLMGSPVRYNGLALPLDSHILDQWIRADWVLPFCPEVSAGLATPRPPAEIQSGDGHTVNAGNGSVMQNDGIDVTKAFLLGAAQALKLCITHNIKVAILTESSPSCGSATIHDGQFSGTKKTGQGVTAALLTKNGIKVFSQSSLSKAQEFLSQIEKPKITQ